MGSRSINRTTQTRPCVAVKNWHVMSAELRAMSAWPPMEPVIVYGARRRGAAPRRWDNGVAAGSMNFINDLGAFAARAARAPEP